VSAEGIIQAIREAISEVEMQPTFVVVLFCFFIGWAIGAAFKDINGLPKRNPGRVAALTTLLGAALIVAPGMFTPKMSEYIGDAIGTAVFPLVGCWLISRSYDKKRRALSATPAPVATP
jgi:hypothetical protein